MTHQPYAGGAKLLAQRRPVIAALLVMLAIPAFTLAGCKMAKVPLTRLEVPVPNVPVGQAPPLSFLPGFGLGLHQSDLRGVEWNKAFDTLHKKLSREYPYTEWKGIDWQALHERFSPAIAAAQDDNDPEALYLALRGYLYAIPDGNIRIEDQNAYKERAIGGGFGMSVLPLDDGRVVVFRLAAGGSAEKAGIRWGAEIRSWDGVPIEEALEKSPILWAGAPAATDDGRRMQQCRFLTRGPVDSKVIVAWRNPGAETDWAASLTAEADDYLTTAHAMRYGKDFGEFESPFDYELRPDGVAYLRLYFLAPTLDTPFPARAFEQTLEKLSAPHVRGMVLDLRGNPGGDDSLATKFLGHFFSTETFYRDIAMYDAKSRQFEVVEKDRLMIEPREPRVEKPVVVLIDGRTFSAAEGIALALQPLPNVKVVGARHSYGAFGWIGGEITMPRGFTLHYPNGRTLDANGAIIGEGDANGQGGVAPDVAVPLTMESLQAHFQNDEDVALNTAIEVLNEMAPATGK